MIAWVWGVASAVTVGEVPNPRDHGGWVTDLAEVIPPADEAELERRLAALHADLDVEVAVVAVRDVDAPTPKSFATDLFATWGIGDREANNGLLVLLVLDQRRLEMETGYGLEPLLPDGWLGTMQAERMVPAFKQGSYGAGLVRGVAAVEERLREHPEDARLGTGGPIAVARQQHERSVQGAVAAGVAGLGAAGVLAGVLGARHRRRQRTCEKCGVYMPMLDEAADDAHLDAGQRTEEQIGSVDWQVHQCPQCQAVHTFERRRWFSGYSQCPRCAHRTRSSTSTTVRAATRYSGGLVRVDERCAHCSFRASSHRHTAPLPDPSTTSSSSFGGGGGGGGGGGSFGGGSSGGGGAGSSW